MSYFCFVARLEAICFLLSDACIFAIMYVTSCALFSIAGEQDHASLQCTYESLTKQKDACVHN